MRIFFIGWFIKNRNGDGIVRAYSALGDNVYRAAMDTQTASELSPHDLHIRSHFGEKIYTRMINRETRVPVQQLLERYCPDAELVYIYQTSVPVDTRGVQVPVVYYHHEFLLPTIPDGRIDLILYNYHGCKEQLDKIYKDRLIGIQFVQSTFGMELDRYSFWNGPRPIFMGFKGAFKADNPDNDPAMEGIYINRNRFVEYARDHLGCYVESFCTNPNEMDELIKFLQHCNIGLNIPGCCGNWGFNNERMTLIMSIGCVLMQYWFPKCEEMGLKDRENCLLFHDEKELEEQFNWAKAHPEDLDRIRKAGYELVKSSFEHKICVAKQREAILSTLFKDGKFRLDLRGHQMFELAIPQKLPNLLLIGDNSEISFARYFYYLLKRSFNVYWIGKKGSDLDISTFPQSLVHFNGLMGEYPLVHRKISLDSIGKILQVDFHACVHFQDGSIVSDEKKLPFPYIFVWHYAQDPYVSKIATMILCATKSMMDQSKFYNPEIPVGYLPHFLLPPFANAAFSEEGRDIQAFFSGDLYNPESIYIERERTAKYLRDNMKGFESHWMGPPEENGERAIEQGKGRLPMSEYRDKLLHSKYGLNCPTMAGFNFRDLEIAASGAILVTKRNRDLELFGFEHGKNCYFYDSPAEAMEIMSQPYNSEIAFAGYTIANFHNVRSRVIELERIIKEILK